MSAHTLALVFGLLGNIISFFVFLSPLPTFYQIYKKKTTDGFQSIPYVVALFSAMLLMYYAFLKTDGGTLIITINSFGCLIESFYIGVYFYYASKKLKVETIKVMSVMIGSYGLILGVTHFFIAVPMRVRIVGWICLVFSVCVFAAPLCILKKVIKTKSVEFMPFSLSFTLTLNAVMWFFYGLFINDYNIAVPNILGFFFGLAQMGLYMKYRKPKTSVLEQEKIGKVFGDTKDVTPLEKNSGGKLHESEKAVVIDVAVIDVTKLCKLVDIPPTTAPTAFNVANSNRDVSVNV